MSEQKSRLSIEIDSTQAIRDAKAVSKELEAIRVTGDFAAKSVGDTSKSLSGFAQGGAKSATVAKNLASQVGGVGVSAKSASDGMHRVTQNTAASADVMTMAGTAAQTLASRIAAVATVSAAISKMDAFAGHENRLKLVTDGHDQLKQAMIDTFTIAQSSRQGWDSVVQVYQRFSENAKELGINMKQAAELTETVSKAVAISGASAASAEAALTQFGQALASGVLRGEELNSVMEQTPGLAKAIAQGMGVTIGQLRSVAAEGKITTDVLVDALTKSQASVDELFGKTSMTIGQSMTTLNNEITKFVGESGKASGAAQAIAQSIQLVSENVNLIASAALIGGVAMVTKAILTKGIALRKTAIDATTARTAVQALAIQEQQLAASVLADAKAHLASVQATNAATQAKYGATAAAGRYKLALDQVSTAQGKVDSLGKGLSTIGSVASKGLALVGGSLGALTLGITAATVAYGYFLAKAAEATAKLKEQAKTADETDEALKKLTGTERQKAVDNLTATFKDQEKQLRKSELAMGSALVAVENHYGALSKEAEAARNARTGVISYNEAIEQLNKLKINKDMYDRLVKERPLYDEVSLKIQNTASKLNLFGQETVIAGNASQNAAAKHKEQEVAISGVAAAAEKARGELKKLTDQQKGDQTLAEFSMLFHKQGYSIEQAEALATAMAKVDYNPALFTEDAKDQVLKTLKSQKDWNNLKDAANKKLADQNKALEKQNKLIAQGNRLVGISGNSGSSTGPHLHVQYGGSKLGDKPTTEHLNRLKAGNKGLASYGVSSGIGSRKPPTKGASSNHKGLDIGMPVGTPITTNVAVKSVTTHTQRDKKSGAITGAGHYTRVVFEDGIVMEMFHQVPDIHSKVKGGSSAGNSNSRTYTQQESYEVKQQREAERFAKEGETLRAHYYTVAQKDKADHEKRMTDLRKHGLTSEVKMEEKRYEHTKQLRELEQVLAVDGWRWVGETKINNDAAVNKMRIQASTDLGKREKEIALQSIEEQRQFEINSIRIIQREKQFAYDQDIARRRRDIDDLAARSTMTSSNYQRYSLTHSQASDYQANNDQLTDNLADIERQRRDGEFADLQEYHRRVEAEKLLHKEKEHAISLEYKQKEDDLIREQQQSQLQLWGSLLSQGQNTWSQLTQAVKDGSGEQSSAFKAMFAAQQAFSIASAIVSAHVAAAQTTADITLPFVGKVPAASAILAFGYAQAGMIAGQAIAGFSGGGYTGAGGKYDPAGIVHKGEVIWSQEDIKRWGGVSSVESMRTASPTMERKRLSAVGDAKNQQVNTQPKIIINTPPGTYVETSTDSEGAITIDIVRKEAASAASNAVKQSWGRIGDYNSHEAKQIVKSFNISPKR